MCAKISHKARACIICVQDVLLNRTAESENAFHLRQLAWHCFRRESLSRKSACQTCDSRRFGKVLWPGRICRLKAEDAIKRQQGGRQRRKTRTQQPITCVVDVHNVQGRGGNPVQLSECSLPRRSCPRPCPSLGPYWCDCEHRRLLGLGHRFLV